MANRGQFYDLLRNFMNRRKMTQKDLAADTGLGSSLPKYVKGTRRITDIEIVDQIADSLKLNYEDRKQLRNAWRLETYGSHRLKQWKLLDDFFQNYHIDRTVEHSYSFRTDIKDNAEKYIFLNGELDIQQAILAVLDDYSRNSGGDGAADSENLYEGMNDRFIQDMDIPYLVMQPDDSLMELFRFAGHNTENFRMKHLFYIPERYEETSIRDNRMDRLYLKPLEYLQAVIPVILESSGYESGYYYWDLLTESKWPLGGISFLVSEKYAVLFGNINGGRTGIFSKDEKLVSYFRKKFRQLYKDTQPFLTTTRDFSSLVDSYYNPVLLENREKWFSYSEQPCLCQYLNEDIISRYAVQPDGPQGDAVREILAKFLKNVSWFHENQRSYYTEYSRLSGLLRFIETGQFNEIPAVMYRPLKMKDRIDVVKRWLADQGENPTIFIREEEPAYNRLSVHCFPNRGLNINFFSETLPCIFSTEEKSLVRDFTEYFTHVREETLMSRKESEKIIRDMIKKAEPQD